MSICRAIGAYKQADLETLGARELEELWTCPVYGELSIVGAMTSSGLCGVERMVRRKVPLIEEITTLKPSKYCA